MIEEKLQKVMSQILKVPIEKITADASPDTIESWDSLRHMNLVLALEQDFGVSFTEEEIVQLLSFEIIHEILREKIRA